MLKADSLKKSKDEAENDRSIIFKKYRILKHIAGGSFGTVFLGINIKTNEKVAIKIEERIISKPTLEREAYILFSLKNPGIPELKTFGRTRKYNILIQSLLGNSLYDIFDDCEKNFTLKDICMLSIQILDRIEFIHSKNYIHRDIKPQNILIGINNPNFIYLIDFGLAKKYKSDRGNHVKYSVTRQVIGTPRFCSINALKGIELSRRDDLESVMYIILYFIKKNLPWQGLKINDREMRFRKIAEIKKNCKLKDLCEGMPKELYDFCKYVKKLEFEENPDYDFMRNCFYNILKNNGMENDTIFSWIQEREKNKIINVPKLIKKNKTSPYKRLLSKIQISLENKSKEKKQKENIEKNKNINNNNIALKNNVNKNDNNCSITPIYEFYKEKEKNDITLNTLFENNDGMDISGIDITNDKNKNFSFPNNNLPNFNKNTVRLSLNKLNTQTSSVPNKFLNLAENNEKEKEILTKSLTKNSIKVNNFPNFKYHYLPINIQNKELKLNDNSFLKTDDYIPSINVEQNMKIDPALDKISKIEFLKSQISATKDIIFFDASNNVNVFNNQTLKLHNYLRQEEKKDNVGFKPSNDSLNNNNFVNNKYNQINMINYKKESTNNCKINNTEGINTNNNNMKRVNNKIINRNTYKNNNNSNAQNLRKVDNITLENNVRKNNLTINRPVNNRQNAMNMNKNYRKIDININNINNTGTQMNNYKKNINNINNINNKNYIVNKNNNENVNRKIIKKQYRRNRNIPLNITINDTNDCCNYKSPLLNKISVLNQNKNGLNYKRIKFTSNNNATQINNDTKYFSQCSSKSPNVKNHTCKITTYSNRNTVKPSYNNGQNNKNILNNNKNINVNNINNVQNNGYVKNKIMNKSNTNYQIMNSQNNLGKKYIYELPHNLKDESNNYNDSNYSFPRKPKLYNRINNNININISQSVSNNFLFGDQKINYINQTNSK